MASAYGFLYLLPPPLPRTRSKNHCLVSQKEEMRKKKIFLTMTLTSTDFRVPKYFYRTVFRKSLTSNLFLFLFIFIFNFRK